MNRTGAEPGSAARLLAMVCTVCVLLVTLYPTGQQLPPDGWICILCDPRLTADLIANVLLFLPVGIAYRLIGWPVVRVLMLAACLSLLIELVQHQYLPSRDANPLDTLANTTGAGLGILLRKGWRAARSGDPLPAGLRAAGLFLPVGILLSTGILLAPAPTLHPIQVRWDESPGGLERYPGRVISAEMGGAPLPRQEVRESGPLRAALLGGERLELAVELGPPPPALAHIFSLHDIRNREQLLVAIDGEDLLLRYRTRAASLRLDEPSHRLVGVLKGRGEGETVRLSVRRDGSGFCLAVQGPERCHFGAGLERGWSFVLFTERLPEAMVRLLDALWTMGLAAPVGFFFRGGRLEITAAGTFLFLSVGGVAGVHVSGLAGWVAIVIGVTAGLLMRSSLRRSGSSACAVEFEAPAR